MPHLQESVFRMGCGGPSAILKREIRREKLGEYFGGVSLSLARLQVPLWTPFKALHSTPCMRNFKIKTSLAISSELVL